MNNSTLTALVNQFELCYSTNLTRPLRLLVQSEALSQAGLSAALARYTRATGIAVALELVNSSAAASVAEEELQLNPQARDAWVLDGSGITTLAVVPAAVLDLTAWATANYQLQFDDYAPFWKGPGPSFGGSLVSLPVQGRNLLLFYR